MPLKLNKHLLQGAVFFLAFIPVLAGGWGVIAGPAGFADIEVTPGFDSHFRYLSGLLLAIGYGFWSTLRNIERKQERFIVLTVIVFIGGLARLSALLVHGDASPATLAGLGMELVVTPALCLWQAKLARQFKIEAM